MEPTREEWKYIKTCLLANFTTLVIVFVLCGIGIQFIIPQLHIAYFLGLGMLFRPIQEKMHKILEK